MKKKLLSMLTLMTLCISGAWAETVPVLTTDVDNPHLYTIGSYDRGGYLTSNGAGNGVTHVDMSNSAYWYFTAAEGNETGTVAGGVIAHNYDGTCLTTSWTTAAEGGVVYILPNGVNENGLAICKNPTIQGSDCMDANNYNAGVGTWAPGEDDWEGTTWVFAEATLDISNYKTNAITTLNTYYLASSDLISTYTDQINKATTTKSVDVALATAFAAYQTEVASKLWIIRSGFNGYYNQQGVYKCFTYAYNGGTTMGWGSEDHNNVNQYMHIDVIAGGKINIKAQYAGTYMQGVAGAMGAQSGASAVTLVKYEDGTFNLNFHNGTAHTNGHSSGAGVSGNLVNWAGGAGTASSWVFVEAAEADYQNAVAITTKMYHPVSRVATLDGTYMIYNGCYNNTEDRTGFMKSNNGAIAHVGNHDRAITYQANYANLFEVHPVDGVENGYTIFSVKDQCYVGANGQKANAAATIYIQPWATSTHTKAGVKFCDNYGEMSDDDATGFWTIGASASGNSGNNCWNGNPTSFALWSNSHPWAFYSVAEVESGVTDEMLTIANSYAAHKVSQNAPHTNKYGSFTEATMSSVEALSVGDTFEAYVTAVTNTTETTLVTPAKGTFIRIQGVSGNYISSNSTSGQAALTNDTNNAVLWYSAEGELIGFQNGLGFTGTHSVAAYDATKEKHTFIAGTTGNDKLQIMSNFSGSKYMYDSTDKLNRNSGAHTNTNWVVTDVESLPVTITEAGLATLYAPVALTIPADVNAYTMAENGEYLKGAKIESGIIPANTGVVLEAETAGTYNFNITTGGEGESCLSGTTYAIAAPANVYTLANGEDGLGFYQFNGTVLGGFKAYYQGSSAEVKGFKISFGDIETGIVNVNDNDNDNVIYNLAGQRVQKLQKGINIVGGKKVLY